MKVEINVSGVTEIEEGDLASLQKADWEAALGILKERGEKIKYEVREIYMSKKAHKGGE